MASIHEQLEVEVAAEQAWQALRNVAEADKLFAPVLAHASLEGNVRTVRFANGAVVRERIVDVDDERRRVAYGAIDGPGMTYHHASMEIIDIGNGHCLFHWTTDFLPPEVGRAIAPLIEQGAKALKANLERKY